MKISISAAGKSVKSDLVKSADLIVPQYWSVHVAKESILNKWRMLSSLSVYVKSGMGFTSGISMPLPSKHSSDYISMPLDWLSSLTLISKPLGLIIASTSISSSSFRLSNKP